MTRQVVVEIVGDASKFSKATGDAITKTEGLTSKLKNVGKGMAIGAGIGAFGLLSGAVDTAIGKLGEAAAAYREDQAGQQMLALALKNNIPNWDGNAAGAEAYAAAQGRLGFADDEVRASLAQLVGVTGDLTKAQEINSLAQELARAKGIDLAQATDILTKAHMGNGKALKGLGVDIGDAKTGAELLDAVQKNVAGSAEAWAATNEGKLAASNVAVGEAMEKVGKVVDDVAQVALPILADAFTTVIDVLGQVWEAVGPVVNSLMRSLRPAFEAMLPIAKQVFGTILRTIKDLRPVFETVFAVIGKIIATAVQLWGVQFEIVKKVIGTVVDVFKGIGTVVGKVFDTIPKAVRSAFNLVIGAINGIIRAINSVKVSIPKIGVETPMGFVGFGPFSWNGLNLASIPYLHSGGLVPGTPGSDVLAMLQAGERVLPASARGTGVTVIVNGSILGVSGVDELMDIIAVRLRLQGV